MAANYLEQEATQDRLSVDAIRRLTQNAIESLLHSQFANGVWPYELVSGAPEEEPRPFSNSTQAMILHAIASSVGAIDKSALVPALQGAPPLSHLAEKAMPALRLGLNALLVRLESSADQDAPQEDASDQDAGEVQGPPVTKATRAALTKSATWGIDDPLTLTWLWEVLTSLGTQVDPDRAQQVSDLKERIAETAGRRLESALASPPGPLLVMASSAPEGEDARQPTTGGSRRSKHPEPPHPFILLRVVQLANCISASANDGAIVRNPILEEMFRNTLNRELANSSVPDGGFDPASLVFSLEGLTILNPDLVQDNLLDRTLEVLASAQGTGSHWRPVRPIRSTPQGLVLLPQSIEVANSLLRICATWEAIGRAPLFSQSLPVLRQYAEWAVASSVRLDTQEGRTSTGWQSEHTHVPGTIHLWATSQSILFLEHYAAMLDRHIARSSREAANLEFRPAASNSPDTRLTAWQKETKHEPLLGVSPQSQYRIYDTAQRLFVGPHVDGNGKANYSMLLFGPPGTGKTTFAQALADALGYDFISISPSDFTRSGESGVEARAQQLFAVLAAQSRSVILFDEIDRLLLDRDSKAYEDQGDIFQFMTPSMLTKINDLRKRENNIFIIATNYAERIDGAIKRPGRIDAQMLLMPPDLTQRKQIIADAAERACRDSSPSELLTDEQCQQLAMATPLYVFKELEAVVYEAHRWKNDGKDFTETLRKLGSATPTISLASYKPRFPLGSDGRLASMKGPWLELGLIVYVLKEAGATSFPDWARQVVTATRDQLDDDVAASLSDIKS